MQVKTVAFPSFCGVVIGHPLNWVGGRGKVSRSHDPLATLSSPAGLATTLMDATTDKDPLVHEQIFSALCYLGGAEPEEVLNACEEYLRQHEKVKC